MKHIEFANSASRAVAEGAKRQNPDQWAEMSSRFSERGMTTTAAFCVVVAIAARGYWMKINGQWFRNGL